MLDEKSIQDIKRKVEKSIDLGEIIKEKEGQFVHFFLNNAKNSLESASLLFKASTNLELKKYLGLPNFNGLLWVINSSYYSMFYTARALLESKGIKIKSDTSIHSDTFNALVFYFYLTGKIERSLVEDLKEAGIETADILGKEKAKELVDDYSHEKDKRGRFTYEMGEIAMKNKAETSLMRARKFNEEVRKIIEKIAQ